MYINHKKTGVYFVLLVIFFMVTIDYIVAIQEKNQVFSEIHEKLELEITRESRSLSRQISQYCKNAIFLSETPPIQGIARASKNGGVDSVGNSDMVQWKERLAKIFSAYIKSNPDVRQVRYIGIANHGKELVRVELKNNNIVIVPDSRLQSKDSNLYFKKTAHMLQGDTYVSEINLNREFGRVEIPSWPTLRISTPIFDANGKLFGLIVINTDAQTILNSIVPIKNDRFTSYLLNSQGEYIWHPDKSKAFGFDLGKNWRWNDEFKLLSDSYVKGGLELYEKSDQIFYVLKKKLVLGTKKNNHEYITLVTLTPKSILNNAVKKVVIGTTLICIALIGVILGVFFLFYYQSRKIDSQQINLVAILNSTQDIIISRSLDGSIDMWNKAAEKMFGYTLNMVVGRSFHDLNFSAEILEKDEHALAFIMQGAHADSVDIKVNDENENAIILSMNLLPIKDKNNVLVGIVSIFYNVSIEREAASKSKALNRLLEKKVQERALEINRISSLQKAIVDNAAYAIIATDKEGVVTLFNAAAERMLGYCAKDVIQKQTPSLWHDPKEVEERALSFSKELNEPIAPGFDVFVAKSRRKMLNQHEWSYIRQDGTRFPVMLGISMLLGEDGIYDGYIGIASDISSRKQAEEDLVLLRDELTAAAEIAELGVWSWYPEDNILEWNDKMYAMYEQPLLLRGGGLSFKHWSERLHPEDSEKTIAELMNAVEGQGEFHPVFRIILPDGRIRYILAGAKMQFDKLGKLIRVTGFNRDITEQHEYESLLLQAKEKSEAANIAKSSFIANMSHEIRTPMNAIIGFLQLLKNSQLNITQQDYLSKLDMSSKVLLAIVNDILDFSKIESGNLTLNCQPINLESIIISLSPILSINIGKKDLEVLFDIDKELPNLILADELRLQQILLNLSSNALKFTESGEVIIKIKKISEKNHKVMINFTVKDTGIGISPDQSKNIFNSFSQAEVGTTRKYGGTGLGLAISQKLVKLMGGELLVKSKLGEGSKFYFALEFAVAKSDKKSSLTNYGLHSLRFLVVDDNSDARTIISEMLCSFGWTVDTASSGKEAISKVIEDNRRGLFDVIFMDWRMPDMNGWETSKRIRELSTGRRSPIVIMVTAYHTDIISQYRKKISTVLDDVILKPITPSTIFDCVANLCLPLNKKITNIDSSPLVKRDRLFGLRILVVEDNPSNQMVAHDLLVNEGALVQIADSGLAAIEAINKDKALFDVVLMDIQMPDMDGYETTEKIRKLYDFKKLPIIAMTANALVDHQENLSSCHMNGFISKPFDLDELVSIIRNNTDKGLSKNIKKVIDSQLISSASNILNTTAAIARLGGNKKVFYKALANFVTDTQRELENLPEVLGDSLEKELAIIHSLKGLTSTFGAENMNKIVNHAYKKLHKDNMPTKSTWAKIRSSLINSGNETVAEALRILESIEIENSPKVIGSGYDVEFFEKELTLLLRLLKTNNMEALKIYDQLKKENSSGLPKEFESLGQSIDNLDFSKAVKYCQILLTFIRGGEK
ncbi:MAG: response regulator [Legionellaceae bacterium]|nr:response regulator [Legionellaceae bacterium]